MKINTKANRLLFWAVNIILFLPLVIIPPNFQPSDWTRGILLRIILTGLVSFLLFKFFYKKEFSPTLPAWKNPVYLPLLALLGLLIATVASTLFSQDISFSIFSSPTRAGGVLNFLFFCIFAIMIGFFVEKKHLPGFIKLNFIAGIVVSAVAIIQYFGLLKDVFIAWEAGGPPSLLGSSTFVAIYMIFLAFAAITFFFAETDKKKKVSYLVLFLIFSFTILTSGSRAAYLGMLMGFIFYFLFFPTKFIEIYKEQFGWLNAKKLKLLKIIFVAFVGIMALALLYINMTPKLPDFIENNKQLSHFLHNRLSFETVLKDLAGTRLSAWKITWQAIEDKPLLGWGPENSYIGFEKHYDPTLPPGLQKLWWDRPHNVFLEVLVNSGFLALFFYLAFWAILIWQLQKYKNRWQQVAATSESPQLIAHAIQAMCIGYLVALSFQFDSFATYMIAFFFIGYAFSLISSMGQEQVIVPPQKNLPFKKVTVTIFAVLLVVFFWSWNMVPLYRYEKVTYAKGLSCKKSLQMLNAISFETYGIMAPFATLKYSDALKNCAYTDLSKEVEYSQKALAALKVAAKIQPYYTRTWIFMGSFANILGAREENPENKGKFIEEAIGYLEKAKELSPKRQEIFIELEKSYLVIQDYEGMKKVASDCIAIDQGNSTCYWYLGIAEIFLGEQAAGTAHINEAKEKGYTNPPYKQLAVAYMSQENYKDALAAYEAASVPSINDFPAEAASHYAVLAYLYRQTGDYVKAGTMAFNVFTLQPENQETIPFIRMLLGLRPDSIDLHFYLAYIYKEIGELGKYQQELSILENAYLASIAQKPNDISYRLTLVDVYRKLEEYQKAVDQAIIMTKRFPNNKDGENIARALPAEYWAVYAKEFGLKEQ